MDNKGNSTVTTSDREPGVEMSSLVPTKYRGTVADARDMKILGKMQVLRRNFRLITMLGFASTVMASWEVLLVLFKLILVDGGTSNLFWGFVVDACGWLSAIGWQVYLAGVCFMVGGLIQALIRLNNESYVPERWHQTLLTIAVVSTSVVFNTVLAVKLPLIEGVLLCLHLCGVLVVVIPLWAMAPSKPVNTAPFNYTNVGGWDTKGLAALIGMVTPLNVLIGYDCTVHMAEELHDAAITLPKIRTGEPFVQVFYNATGSKAASSVMVAIVIILLISCCFSEVATASRQLWSFARDKGLPASSWLEQCRTGTIWLEHPSSGCGRVICLCSTCSLINIGSTTTLRSISSLGAVAILASYLVTIGTLI
ncbi:hypothetical protein KC332_g6070 [Hortaea werneckii]|uniref:Uncharacterized protein n=1 Tax=Hortaea werneckii EXF-2000 TaxID=1157616 RepID=A0A1Z5SUZ2_HORWE|nr:hypothetical protein KC358_g5900 [Hortaea werneckii]OTA24646.1 hypothetical protein BTJ68_13344 [Hortaea werneckii EXF-2000]KAI6841825.1 hypothetical protein KC350_g5173 [Hortaea werneckii]KAI6935627.1 hypothetical protein KC348_g6198 [Hortaea werneckii]KAI6937241.1 hypothetical protein KC341_g5708 [Hortaea werneckii]